jgi:TPR repeat protein
MSNITGRPPVLVQITVTVNISTSRPSVASEEIRPSPNKPLEQKNDTSEELFRKGRELVEGKNNRINFAQAAGYFGHAAKQGHAQSQVALGLLYCTENGGVPRDVNAGRRWASQGIEKTRQLAVNGDAFAQWLIGLAYSSGTGVSKDPVESAKWYRRSADQGLILAKANLGFMLCVGIGVEKNIPEGRNLLQESAKNGSAVGQYLLGMFYRGSAVVQPNQFTSVEYLKKAAEQGYAPAQHELALAHAKGMGVMKNIVQAFRLCQLSAEQHYAPAQYDLGLAYQLGAGVPRNLDQARVWISKAEQAGNPAAVGWMIGYRNARNRQ